MNLPKPKIVITKEQTQALCRELLKQPLVALDTEWVNWDKNLTPVCNGQAFCLTFCWRDRGEELQAAYVHNYGEASGNIWELRPWLESPEHSIVGWNVPVDWHIIANHGIHTKAFNIDGLVMDFLLDENRENMHGLKQCVADHLKLKAPSYDETFGTPRLKKNGQPYASGAREPISLPEVLEQPGGFEKLVDYACSDAVHTWLLMEYYRPKMQALPWLGNKTLWDYFLQRETKLMDAIIQIERRGLPLDVPFIRLMHQKAVHDQELTEAALLELVGVPMKISSGKQLAALLYGNPDEPQYFERKEDDEDQEEGKRRRKKKVDFYLRGLGLPVLRQTEKGAPSTKAEHIAELVRWAEKQDALGLQPDTLEILQHIKDFNGRKTQISTFLEGLPNMARRNGRVHGRIVRTGATSGRFCVHPNTIIETDKGRFAISDPLLRDGTKRNILTHTGRMRPITHVFSKGREQMHRVTLENGAQIVCTMQHRFLTPAGWRSLKELQHGAEVIFADPNFVRRRLCEDLFDGGAISRRSPCDLRNNERRVLCQQETLEREVRQGAGCLALDSRWRGEGQEERSTNSFTGHSPSALPYQAHQISARGSDARDSEGFTTARITCISLAEIEEVWDLTVEEDASYVAHGFVNHNSSSQPNLQNLTTGKKDVYHIRDAICAPPGYCLIVADFSQLEYRLLSHFTQEPKLITLFKQGWDLHSMSCVNMYPHVREELLERFGEITTEGLTWVAEEYPDERKCAKTFNFELIYGVGYRKLADQLRIPEEEAKRMVNDWFAGYPHVNMWKERVLSTLRTGTPVRTIAGRYRRPVLWRLLHKDRGIRGGEERTLVNAVIQGSAADITNKAMVNILDSVELRELGYAMINQVHDELVGECPIKNYERVVQLLRPLMEHPFEKPLRVPMPVAIGVGHSWANSKV